MVCCSSRQSCSQTHSAWSCAGSTCCDSKQPFAWGSVDPRHWRAGAQIGGYGHSTPHAATLRALAGYASGNEWPPGMGQALRGKAQLNRQPGCCVQKKTALYNKSKAVPSALASCPGVVRSPWHQQHMRDAGGRPTSLGAHAVGPSPIRMSLPGAYAQTREGLHPWCKSLACREQQEQIDTTSGTHIAVNLETRLGQHQSREPLQPSGKRSEGLPAGNCPHNRHRNALTRQDLADLVFLHEEIWQ